MTLQVPDLSDDERSGLRQALLAPASVALIGASGKPGRVTSRPLQFLRQNDFKGAIYPVNPRHGTVMDTPAYASVGDIGQPIDHAYIMLNTDAVLDCFAQCARAGVKVVSVLADGFAESGDDGRRRQQRLTAMADEAGILLLGPNSMGTVDLRSGFVCTTNAAFVADTLNGGRTAVISQSGSLIGTILSRGQARGLAYSTFISTGNEAGVGVGELGQLLIDDPGIDSFVLFLETLRSVETIRGFADKARRLNKSIVAYMTGLSDEGQALATSHTGALVGQRVAADSFLKQVGIHRVNHFESLLEAPQALSLPRPGPTERNGVTVVTTTGGGGAMVIDQLSLRGVHIVQPSDAIRQALVQQRLPQGHGKLIDVTLAGARYEVMKAVLDAIISDPDSGVIVVAIGSSAQFNPELAVRPVIDAVNDASDRHAARVVAFPIPQADHSLRLLADAGIPAFRTVESCAECVSLMLRPAAIQAPPDADQHRIRETIDAHLAGKASTMLTETDASALFQSLGIAAPVSLTISCEQPLPPQLPFDYPCVVKLISADIAHKTEIGAVRLGLHSHTALTEAVADMTAAFRRNRPDARLDGVLVQATETGVVELLIGATRDPVVGPIVTVGMGGRLAELYQDTATRPAPVTHATAAAMLRELKLYPLFEGYRGGAAADVDAATDAIVKLSQTLLHDLIAEAEINPLLVRDHGAVALDALVRLRPDRSQTEQTQT